MVGDAVRVAGSEHMSSRLIRHARLFGGLRDVELAAANRRADGERIRSVEQYITPDVMRTELAMANWK